jgi:hypothetical protein
MIFIYLLGLCSYLCKSDRRSPEQIQIVNTYPIAPYLKFDRDRDRTTPQIYFCHAEPVRFSLNL